MNIIWGAMLILGIITGLFSGKTKEITQALINSSAEAVQLAIVMLGVVAMWSGIMKIGEKAGIVENFSKKLEPLLNYLFPDLKKEEKAKKYIATNMIANLLGLGWAATPSGLMAAKELQKINKDKDKASNSMCMFMIINMSSIQLISVNIIAYRMEYGAETPADILFPTLIVTIISTLAAVIYAKLKEKGGKQ